MSRNGQAPPEQSFIPEPWFLDDLIQSETTQDLIAEMNPDSVGDPMLLEWPLPIQMHMYEDPFIYDQSGLSMGNGSDLIWDSSMTFSDLAQSPHMSLPYWSPEPTMSLLGGSQSPDQASFGSQAIQSLPQIMTVSDVADQTSIVSAAQETHGSMRLEDTQKSSNWKCDSCGYNSKTKRDLHRHITSCDSELAERMGISTSRWPCPKCSKTYGRRDNGIRHMRRAH
jgi:predicted RNA-binding Zn-ribbon protein involved in translation (DUF1610 family)